MHAKARHTYIKYLTFYIELCYNIVNILQLYKAFKICYIVYIALCECCACMQIKLNILLNQTIYLELAIIN